MRAVALDRIERIRRNRDENATPVSERDPKGQATTWPLVAWPDRVRAAPNSFLRSAIFGAIAKGQRQKLENVPLATVDGIELSFTGTRLDQTDLEVWFGVVHAVRTQNLGAKCSLSSYSLLKTMGQTDSGKNRKALEARIVRLVGCAVTLKVGRYKYIGSLICSAATDQVTQRWLISIDPKLGPLFEADQFTLIDWEVRRKLRGHQLAQWLHGYYSSHAKPYPVKVETLHRLCGSQARLVTDDGKKLHDFGKTLRKALDAIRQACEATEVIELDQGVAVVYGFSWRIVGDLVHVDRTPSAAQRRHLAKAKRATRK